jgi:hypothetical protein
MISSTILLVSGILSLFVLLGGLGLVFLAAADPDGRGVGVASGVLTVLFGFGVLCGTIGAFVCRFFH